jgi:hypothetical protein
MEQKLKRKEIMYQQACQSRLDLEKYTENKESCRRTLAELSRQHEEKINSNYMNKIIDGIDGTQFANWNKKEFTEYCSHMIFDTPCNVQTHEWSRSLYKYVEMMWEEDMQRLMQTS